MILNKQEIPWGSGIGKDVNDCTTIREVMEKAGLDFRVDKCPIVAKMNLNIETNGLDFNNGFIHEGKYYSEVKDMYATYRTDTNRPLGIVKSRYEVVQNIDAFAFFEEAIIDDNVTWDKAGYYGYGHKIFVSAKLPFTIDVNGDEINNYLVFSSTHDGSGSINILFSPIRVICLNMLNAGLQASYSNIKIKHTNSAKSRLEEHAKILKIARTYACNAQDIYNALYKRPVTDEQFVDFLAKLILTPAEYTKFTECPVTNKHNMLLSKSTYILEYCNISVRKANIIYKMFIYYYEGYGQKEIKNTAWGAYNAVTGYFSNVAPLNGENRVESLLYGNGYNTSNKALNMLYEELQKAI